MRGRVRAFVGTAAMTVLAALLGSCGGGGGDDTASPAAAVSTHVIRSANLTSSQEVPAPPNPNAGATGRGAVVVNRTTREITGAATFSGLSGAPTVAHIHSAAAGSVGGPIITLTLTNDGVVTAGTASVPPGTTLDSAQLAALEAGNLYFNVHTSANPDGEIRGQLTIAGGVTAGLASLTGGQETPPSSSTATGRGTIVFDSASREIITCYATHNVANPTVAHIHTGASGVAGPADVVTLVRHVGASTFGCPVTTPRTTLSAASVTSLTAGNTYFNVHSDNNLCAPAATCAAGEIRGQIAVVQ